MRWNAIGLSTSLILIVLVSGCSLFGKKKADSQTAEALGDPYQASTYEEPVQTYEPYADAPRPAEAERSYSTVANAEEMPVGARFHTVTKKDTLFRLARMYYSDAARWRDIYEANRGEIENPDKIFIGQRLMIP